MTNSSQLRTSRGRHPTPGPTRRIVAVDNLKALLVAWVIGGHALMGYTAIGGWPYAEVQEGTLPRHLEYALSILLGPSALFAMGAFFFLSGLFAPPAVRRTGPAGYARSRLLRLGIPWLIFMLAIWPFFMWLAYLAAGRDLTYWQAFLGRTPFLDSGPIWFVQVLMYVSLGYAVWARLGWCRRLTPSTVTGAHLLLLAAAIAVVSFLVRLEFPARSKQILDLHLWQWPQLVGMFVLGAMVSGQGWAAAVPDRIARRCWLAVAGTLIAAPLLVALDNVTNFVRAEPTFLGGWRWQAAALDVVEASLVVAGSVGVLWLAQRYLNSDAALPRMAARSAFAAYLLQVPMLLLLEIAARPLPVPIVVKAAIVLPLAIITSFGLAWLLVSRTPLGRVI
jgi:Acyltransferase family